MQSRVHELVAGGTRLLPTW